MHKKNPTIDDVAALSGVGRTTVSRVLNGGPNVREEVRKRVLNSVARLGYKVNPQARFLAGGTSSQIMLVYAHDLDAEPNSYYHSGLELGAMRACAAVGYSLVTQNVDPAHPDYFAKFMAVIDERRCDGMMLTPPFSDDARLIEAIMARSCPVVCISAGPEVQQITTSVGIDDEAAGYALTRHLLSLGHKRFGYIDGLEGHISASMRLSGFQRALAEAGIDFAGVVVERGNFTFRSGIERAQAILARANRPTALFCANDDTAAGALLTAHKLGINIPSELSIAGFDDTPVSEIIWPPLTTVHQPIKQIGRRACELLINAIAGRLDSHARTNELVPFRIVTRSSTGIPR